MEEAGVLHTDGRFRHSPVLHQSVCVSSVPPYFAAVNVIIGQGSSQPIELVLVLAH